MENAKHSPLVSELLWVARHVVADRHRRLQGEQISEGKQD